MTKRLTVIGGCALLLVIGIVTTSRLVSAPAAGPVTVLQPTEAFQLQGVDGLTLKDVAAYNGDLFFLLNDQGGSNEILRTTRGGDIVRKIPLPTLTKMQHFGQLRISQSGVLAVSFSHSDPDLLTTVALYNTDGTLKTSFDVALSNEIAFIGDNLVSVRPTGITQLTSQSEFVPNGSSLPLNFVDRSVPILLTASLPQNQLVIVEPVSGSLHIATMDSVLAGPMVLNAPEIQGVQRLKSGDGTPLVVDTIAASPAGNLYIPVTGAKRQEGAPVLQFDRSGRLKNRIKCILPNFGLDPSNHQSYMYPKKLLATNDSLFWISQSEKKVAVYSLENIH
jgi:hypothetical protein